MDSNSKRVGYEFDDRLTRLPDEPLTRILGMIPTKNAALLTLITNKLLIPPFSVLTEFEFDDSPISHCRYGGPCDVKRTPHFKSFVDYVLRTACQSKQLGRFTLRFGRFCGDNKRHEIVSYCTCRDGLCYPPLELARLNAWVSFPLARRVRELYLCLNVETSSSCKLFRNIFVCETLEILKLDSNLDIDVGDDNDVKAFPIRLPRLKLLHLRTLLLKEDTFVTKLIESCPVLEDLLLACWWDCSDVFAISSPSLLNLDLTLTKCDGEKFSSDVIIQTPNLQSLKYWDNLAQRYSIPDLNALVEADITLIWVLVPDGCAILCSILKSCSAVSHLTLQRSAISVLERVEVKYHLPVFLNLSHLELVYDEDCNLWDKLLVAFLERSPSLQTLVFPRGLADLPGSKEGLSEYELGRQMWRTTEASPSCCKSHLKRIVIKKYHGLPHELALMEFLLKKALVLESVDISLSKPMTTPSRGIASRMHHRVDLNSVQSALQDMPRASKFCSIRVTCD